MEITQMTAEELAEQFSTGNIKPSVQTTNTDPIKKEEPVVVDKKPATNMQELLGLSSEELAKKMADGTLPKDAESAEEDKEPETKIVKNSKLDDSIVSKIDELFFKTEKLKPFNTEDGSDYIRPKTWEDLAEVMEANIDEVRSSVKREEKDVLLKEMFQESSPAMQFILENANSFKTPEEMLPLIQSVNQQDLFANLDVNDTNDQEFIVHNALLIQGLDTESIKEEIQDLKDRDKLKDRSEKLKPILDRYSADKTQKILEEQENKNKTDMNFWNGYFQKINEDLISAKDIDGLKLKQEDKNSIASALLPNQQTGGLPIYTLIDNLVGQGNVKLLSKIVLLATNEEAYNNYSLSKKEKSIVNSLQKTLRQSVVASSTDTNEDPATNAINTIQKPKYGNFLNR